MSTFFMHTHNELRPANENNREKQYAHKWSPFVAIDRDRVNQRKQIRQNEIERAQTKQTEERTKGKKHVAAAATNTEFTAFIAMHKTRNERLSC